MDTAASFLSTLTSAISNCALYSREHPSIDEFARKGLVLLQKLFGESDNFDIMIIDDDLVINKKSFKGIGLQTTNLVKRIKRKGLARIEFLPGVTFKELRTFIPEILEVGKKIPDFPHIKTGVIDIRTEEAVKDEDVNSGESMTFLSQQLETMREIYKEILQLRRIGINTVNGVMENMVSAVSEKTNVLGALGYAHSREEFAYVHATNVSILSIFQMKSLGIGDRILLRDIGLAGLLHDIGKLYISQEALAKKKELTEEDWQEIHLHPFYGARVLSSLDGLPPLCAIVSFQHHMRYDGQGYPQTVSPMKQHICSQVVAIADCFDALRSMRPYRKGLEMKEVFAMMRRDSSHAFNPFLLKHFIQRLYKTL